MLFVDSHPDGLVLTDVNPGRRFGTSMGLGRVVLIVVVLLLSTTSASLLAIFD